MARYVLLSSYSVIPAPYSHSIVAGGFDVMS